MTDTNTTKQDDQTFHIPWSPAWQIGVFASGVIAGCSVTGMILTNWFLVWSLGLLLASEVMYATMRDAQRRLTITASGFYITYPFGRRGTSKSWEEIRSVLIMRSDGRVERIEIRAIYVSPYAARSPIARRFGHDTILIPIQGRLPCAEKLAKLLSERAPNVHEENA